MDASHKVLEMMKELKTDFHLNYIYKFYFYLSENSVRLNYINLSLAVGKGDRRSFLENHTHDINTL
jgi:hypothetical protein